MFSIRFHKALSPSPTPSVTHSSGVYLNYLQVNLNCFYFSEFYRHLKELRTFLAAKLNKIDRVRNLSSANYNVNFKCLFKCGELSSSECLDFSLPEYLLISTNLSPKIMFP